MLPGAGLAGGLRKSTSSLLLRIAALVTRGEGRWMLCLEETTLFEDRRRSPDTNEEAGGQGAAVWMSREEWA